MKARRLTFLLLLLVMVVSMGTGCQPAENQGTSEPGAPAPAATEPEQEAPAPETPKEVVEEKPAEPTGPVTLIIATDMDMNTLDIHDASQLQITENMGMQVFDTLLQITPEGFVPRLAEKWEAVEDGWIFYLRKGVVFHDGTPFNAEAVKFNADRLVFGNNRQSSKWRAVESTEIIDEYTVKFVTKGPPSYQLLGNLVHGAAGAMQSPKAVEAGEFPVGTGPFIFVEWIQGEKIIMEKNPDYWMEGKPYIDRVEVQVIPDPATRVLKLEAGEVDFIVRVPPADASRIKQKPNLVVYNPPSPGWRYIGLSTLYEPFQDKRVRQALNYAIDRKAIAEKLLLGIALPLTSPIGSAMWSHIDLPGYEYNPEKAKELLADAGYADGFDVTMIASEGMNTASQIVAEAVQAYLKQVGINMEVRMLEYGVLLDNMFAEKDVNTVQMHDGQYMGADPDALRIMLGCNEFPPNRNHTFYCNQDLEALFQAGITETDIDKRKVIYEDVQKLIWEEAPWIFIAEFPWLGAWNSKVQGLTTYSANQNYYELRDVKIVEP